MIGTADELLVLTQVRDLVAQGHLVVPRRGRRFLAVGVETASVRAYVVLCHHHVICDLLLLTLCFDRHNVVNVSALVAFLCDLLRVQVEDLVVILHDDSSVIIWPRQDRLLLVLDTTMV